MEWEPGLYTSSLWVTSQYQALLPCLPTEAGWTQEQRGMKFMFTYPMLSRLYILIIEYQTCIEAVHFFTCFVVILEVQIYFSSKVMSLAFTINSVLPQWGWNLFFTKFQIVIAFLLFTWWRIAETIIEMPWKKRNFSTSLSSPLFLSLYTGQNGYCTFSPRMHTEVNNEEWGSIYPPLYHACGFSYVYTHTYNACIC